MKQVLRRVIDRKGVVRVVDLPTPHMGPDQVLISTHYTSISSGTELATVGKTPTEMVKQTLQDPWMRNAVKNLVLGGPLRQTADTIYNELTLDRLIGYAGSGVVLDAGANIRHVAVGDRVAFAAQGHAEQVSACANHVVAVPDNVDMKHAAFATVGGIAMQGVRRAEAGIGDWVVVYGLGLVGQLTCQILQASGAKVIGIDLSRERCDLARSAGVSHTIDAASEDVVEAVTRLTGGKGADVTMICAFSKKPEIANNAMKMTRMQGRVVFVGLVKMDLERKPFFLKELDLVFSRAYGPGSYDNGYEKGRYDYPYHYVRWTEQRNLQEVLRLVSENRIDIEPLIDGVFPMEKAQGAFDKLCDGETKSVAMVLAYPQRTVVDTKVEVRTKPRRVGKDAIRIGVIGTGNFTRNYHVPLLARNKRFSIRALSSATGINAAGVAERFGADYMTSDYREVLNDPKIDCVLIATRHDLHAPIAIEAAHAGKHVFLEKPVALAMADWQSVKSVVSESGVRLMVGYNRRYSKLATIARRHVTTGPVMVRYMVNIQPLPDSHWTLDPIEGGGRLLGEADHFVDMMNLFANSTPTGVTAVSLPSTQEDNQGLFNFSLQVQYRNGAIGQLMYTSLGGPKCPRERIEVFGGGRHIELVDYKSLLIDGRVAAKKRDLGHAAELDVFADRLMAAGDDDHDLQLTDTLAASWVCLTANEQLSAHTMPRSAVMPASVRASAEPCGIDADEPVTVLGRETPGEVGV